MAKLSDPIRRVACAISGGVDSAVSAYLVKRQGFDVVGVFMTNWDQRDEKVKCSIDADRDDAKYVAKTLRIDFVELNFVKEYWNDVFSKTMEVYARGMTPNPDILCNRFVKFEKLSEFTLKHSANCHPSICADAFATGHYARNSFGNFLEKRNEYSRAFLLRSIDRVKDQTFWLCNISWRYLQHCMFPIGDLTKPKVKEIAASIGLEKIAKRKEYIEPTRGLIIELETGRIFGEHSGVHHFTIGQKIPGVTWGNEAFYVTKLDAESQEVFIVQGDNHPSLYMQYCVTEPAVWISEECPPLPSDEFHFQWQNKWRPIGCRIDKDVSYPHALTIYLQRPMRCIAPGQFAAIYNGEVCLGGAMIKSSRSLFDEGRHEPFTDWRISDFENYARYSTGGGNFIQNFMKKLKEESDRDKQMKESVRKFREETEKLEKSKEIQSMRAFYKKIESEIHTDTMEKVKDQFESAAKKLKVEGENLKKQEIIRKSIEGISRAGEQIAGVSRSIGKTEFVKSARESLEALEQELQSERALVYRAPDRPRTRAEITGISPERIVEADMESSGIVLHKDSKWIDAWEKFKDNNQYVQKFFDLKTKYEESDHLLAYNVLATPIKTTKELGFHLDSRVLDVNNIDVCMGKMMEQGPVLIITFQAQQIQCIRDTKGAVREGDPEKVLRVTHVWALCRDQSELNPWMAWRVIDVAMMPSEQWM
ncbi:unnamed protein product [Rodentolepis nana]|uniref:tRNA-5-taurinomethyluridine 2-sulfurtransferase n=1 Tax=Rodentolepis nana TaxID=102285 RepID=A0A0R3TKH4_RODNA|nr:unnamed protein product [Rodentolepis nana]